MASERARVWYVHGIVHLRPDSARKCESDTGNGYGAGGGCSGRTSSAGGVTDSDGTIGHLLVLAGVCRLVCRDACMHVSE